MTVLNHKANISMSSILNFDVLDLVNYPESSLSGSIQVYKTIDWSLKFKIEVSLHL
jgi:hypothetical protein